MKENCDILNLAYDLLAVDQHLGTPAGNAPFTQQQLDGMRRRGMTLEATITREVEIVTPAPSPLQKIPPHLQIPRQASRVRCPVINIDRNSISVILPDGRLGSIPR